MPSSARKKKEVERHIASHRQRNPLEAGGFLDESAAPDHKFLAVFFFFFNDTATTDIYTLSLHDALPICAATDRAPHRVNTKSVHSRGLELPVDRKSTRLNSSHTVISYAVFCLKKKKKEPETVFYDRKKQYAIE